jgi:hypothetical protein
MFRLGRVVLGDRTAGSAAFSQCVADLHHSLWDLQNLYKS